MNRSCIILSTFKVDYTHSCNDLSSFSPCTLHTMVFSSIFVRSLSALSLIARVSLAAPSASTKDTCASIKTQLVGKVNFPGEVAYQKENKDYYHVGLAELKPACIVFPRSAEDVSSIVKILNTRSDVQFAVKSGGHSPNVGAASIKDGVLIALRHINGTILNKEKSLADIKPGGHWWDVMKALDGTGQMAVGGRLGVVGIGGYLTQGGVSFLSGQYGLGGDNVVEYETVLANGSIVNINQERHKDLVKAMRGGGSQFGIVTKFTVRTYPVGKVTTKAAELSGNVVNPSSSTPESESTILRATSSTMPYRNLSLICQTSPRQQH